MFTKNKVRTFRDKCRCVNVQGRDVSAIMWPEENLQHQLFILKEEQQELGGSRLLL